MARCTLFFLIVFVFDQTCACPILTLILVTFTQVQGHIGRGFGQNNRNVPKAHHIIYFWGEFLAVFAVFHTLTSPFEASVGTKSVVKNWVFTAINSIVRVVQLESRPQHSKYPRKPLNSIKAGFRDQVCGRLT